MTSHSKIDATRREQYLTALQREQFDVLVIGAGITGCGVARDAAMERRNWLEADKNAGNRSRLINRFSPELLYQV